MPVFDRVSEGLQLRILRAACPAHFLLVDPVHAVGVLRFDKQATGQIARLIFPLRLIPGRKSGKRLETFVLGVELSDVQAKLLLSAMMTDTLMLKSPTTTDVDRAVAAKLGEQVGVDPVKFGMEVFLTRPSGSFTAAEMVGNDIKMFEPAGKKLLIGQYETVDKTRALGMIDEIREAMRAYAAEKGADGIVLCITDIMEEGSQVLLEGETEAAQKGLGIADEHDGVWMPGVLSRKKQVAAPIMAAC